MDLIFALLADYANYSRENKLNVMGIFNRLRADQFPTHHPQMYLVTRFRASPAEYELNRLLTFKLIDQDGHREVMKLSVPFKVPRGAGRSVEADAIIVVNNLRIDDPGDYQFSILLDNDEKGSVPIRVEREDSEEKPRS